ncbi:MAG: DNA double-strand break repair nuclease NurA [Candidatus Nanoarchaeia archaeon]|jgi:hypothetical protein
MLEALKFLKNNLYAKTTKVIDNYQSVNHSFDGCVTAIDGGACIIADGGSWVVSKLRTANVHYDKGLRVPSMESRKDYYYTVIKKSASYEHSFKDLGVDFGNIRELTEIPAVVMKYLEFVHAAKTVNDLPSGSLLLIDGLLLGETKDQVKALAVLEARAKERGINVVGVAKSFRHSINGQSVIGLLIKERPTSKWFYSPVQDSDCFVARLHERAKYAYAINSFKHTNLDEVMPVLAYYSNDPEIIGYPYPLLKVDRDARISGYEKKLEVNKLRILSKKEGMDFIEYDEKSTSMHALMDSQKYR